MSPNTGVFITDEIVNIKTHFRSPTRMIFFVNPICDSPILSADEGFSYHHTFLWDLVIDEIASARVFAVSQNSEIRSHVRTNILWEMCMD